MTEYEYNQKIKQNELDKNLYSCDVKNRCKVYFTNNINTNLKQVFRTEHRGYSENDFTEWIKGRTDLLTCITHEIVDICTDSKKQYHFSIMYLIELFYHTLYVEYYLMK